ncbi:MAG: PemK family transcriptional regulator [Legionellaceae bacterium]|nr:PemK family transcriptional regulator [Legionellaceae bacterium]|tara:strand:+ start:59 stop:379 length:321 start_codon:yes stop_codon:yes gene_type:complete
MKRGDIYWVDLNPTRGSEIKKKRPCVIVGATPINKARRTVVVIPLSGSPKAHPPLTIPVQCMKKNVVAVCDQIRSVDKSRFTEKIESMEDADLQRLDHGLKQVLCL